MAIEISVDPSSTLNVLEPTNRWKALREIGCEQAYFAGHPMTLSDNGESVTLFYLGLKITGFASVGDAKSQAGFVSQRAIQALSVMARNRSTSIGKTLSEP